MSKEFTFKGLPTAVVFTYKTVATIFSSIYSLLGKNGANALLYNAGHKTGKFYVEEIRKITGLRELELLNECVRGDFMAKWGKFEYTLDFDKFEGEVKLYDSFLAKNWVKVTKKEQKYPVCAFIAGYIAGEIESIFGEKVIVEEKACMALGNKLCLFEVKKDVFGD